MYDVEELATEPATLTVAVAYPGTEPSGVYAFWTAPELLTRWWPQRAEVDAREGGSYHLSWLAQDWHLRGTYTAVEPAHRLAFTWRWDGEPETAPVRRVEIRFEPLANEEHGTRLVVSQGTYGNSTEERAERQGHLDGWRYFLPRLGAALTA